MRVATILSVAATTAVTTSAFSVLPVQQPQKAAMASTQISMGLFDFFGEEAKEKRELKKKLAVEEQERMQKMMIERRRNPDLMEEYEANVQYRRELKMKGEFDEAKKVDLWANIEDKTLLDGTAGSKEEVSSEE